MRLNGGLNFCIRNPAGTGTLGELTTVNDSKITPRRSRANKLSAPWEISVICLLTVALQARDARISRLEQLNHSMALAVDEQRRSAGRRGA